MKSTSTTLLSMGFSGHMHTPIPRYPLQKWHRDGEVLSTYLEEWDFFYEIVLEASGKGLRMVYVSRLISHSQRNG